MARKSKNADSQTANLIYIVRTALGLTPHQLAELAEVDHHIVYRAEKGGTVRGDKISKIAKILNMPEDVIYYNMGQFPPDKIELVKKDPIGFKRLVDEFCETPWRLDTTEKYVNAMKDKIKQQKSKLIPVINDMISELK